VLGRMIMLSLVAGTGVTVGGRPGGVNAIGPGRRAVPRRSESGTVAYGISLDALPILG